jgi:hypothetical protein
MHIIYNKATASVLCIALSRRVGAYYITLYYIMHDVCKCELDSSASGRRCNYYIVYLYIISYYIYIYIYNKIDSGRSSAAT